MKKTIFVLAIASLILISNLAFCGDGDGEKEKEGTSVSKLSRTLVPMKKEEEDFSQYFGSQKPDDRKPKIEFEEVDRDKERKDRIKEKKTSTSEQKEKPKINDLVDFLKSTDVTIPTELIHIKTYFSQLEGKDLVEQYQYDKLIETYTAELKKTKTDGSKNPAAIAIFSDTSYVKGSTVGVKNQDRGPQYHSDHQLIDSLAREKGYELKGLKIGLYTRNSPCILRIGSNPLDKNQPCISYINFIVTKTGRSNNPVLFLDSATRAASIMIQYDLIYDDPRSNQKEYISSHETNLNKVKNALMRITESKQKEYKEILNKLYVLENNHPIVKMLLGFELRLNTDKATCQTAKKFSEISTLTFIGTAFNLVYSKKSSSLIFTSDLTKLSSKTYKDAEETINKFLALPTIRGLENIQAIKKVLMEIYQVDS